MKPLAVTLSIFVLMVPITAGAQTQTFCTVDGHAYTVRVEGSGLIGANQVLNLAAVPDGGGADAVTLLDTASLPIPLPLPLRARVVSSSAAGDVEACSASSFTTVADVGVDVLGLVTISADLIQAATRVEPGACNAATDIVGLSIAVLGIPVPIPDPIPANTVIPLGPLGAVTLKESSCSDSQAEAAAVHVVVNVGLPPLLGETIEIVVARADSVAHDAGGEVAASSPVESAPTSSGLLGLDTGSLLGGSSLLGPGSGSPGSTGLLGSLGR